jgi:hypothetical protein
MIRRRDWSCIRDRPLLEPNNALHNSVKIAVIKARNDRTETAAVVFTLTFLAGILGAGLLLIK